MHEITKLMQRGRESSEADIQKRLDTAKWENRKFREMGFFHLLINDNKEEAFSKLISIIKLNYKEFLQ